MDNQTIITIVIAMIVMIPGMLALVNEIKKDKHDQTMRVNFATSRVSDELWELKKKVYGLNTEVNWKIDDLQKTSVEELWKKMYEKPVIVRCNHCESPNLITNLNCSQCGAPTGDFKEIKNEN